MEFPSSSMRTNFTLVCVTISLFQDTDWDEGVDYLSDHDGRHVAFVKRKKSIN